MIQLNENFFKLQENYLFSTIKEKVNRFQKENPDKKVIKLGIGDVTLPIPSVITDAIKNAAEEISHKETFKGYGPEQGYDFLRKAIVENDYLAKGIFIEVDDIFVSDGAKCDTGNIVDLFSNHNVVAISDPVYPVYLDSNVIAGRAGKWNLATGKYEKIIYMEATKENGFEPKPEELKGKPDLIYLCSPNNPTGMAMTKEALQSWVTYAKENDCIILYDAAYEAFITQKEIPHSIYEIEGAKEVAIEFKSFSKTAGFTGLRCAYVVIPKELKIKKEQQYISLNQMWSRRQSTKFNGVSYLIQKAAEAVYSEEGQKEIKKNILYYQENAKIMKSQLELEGYEVYGGINAPYLWLKIPNDMKSWEFFDLLLHKIQVVGTPGIGFGPKGEGYFRLTAFGDRDETIEAMRRWKLK